MRAAKAFYLKALAPLDYQPCDGSDAGTDRVTIPRRVSAPMANRISGSAAKADLDKPLHVAIVAKDRATVDAFYKAAMAAGGRDNGAPGIRAHYHPNYYGAFVLDPDGHNIEAVCHAPA